MNWNNCDTYPKEELDVLIMDTDGDFDVMHRTDYGCWFDGGSHWLENDRHNTTAKVVFWAYIEAPRRCGYYLKGQDPDRCQEPIATSKMLCGAHVTEVLKKRPSKKSTT